MLTEQVEDWTKEWWENGLEQGLKEGQRNGEALIVIRLLERRFGPLSAQHRDRLEAADTDTLLEWSDRILTANSIGEVLQR